MPNNVHESITLLDHHVSSGN